ncbi:hypothetical protein Taro_037291 [Colocasia esculenta]|uniref:Uncharacterized protein n=1 Tax=Colocasia esculenta TaxID=4460 RepID=A0A843W030_COLES|nr:hypothetical protein [Colocasia esculenta]
MIFDYLWSMITMATRGCRGAGPARGDESAGDQQAPAQQAQDQTGVPLPPPPPPVDYGALMQGLVHAMQTQAQTTAALQAQAPANEAIFGGVPMMERFRRMTPPFFKGESDPILAEIVPRGMPQALVLSFSSFGNMTM